MKIDLEKFVCSLLENKSSALNDINGIDICNALLDQGLEYRDGAIVEIESQELKNVEQNTTDNDMKEALRTEYAKGRADAIAEFQKGWSEEDIATISRVISIVKWAAYSDHSHPILNDEGATELVERLKSLKERYTWKPSDEQIKELEFFIPYVTKCSVVLQKSKDILLSLLSDLKKLREK